MFVKCQICFNFPYDLFSITFIVLTIKEFKKNSKAKLKKNWRHCATIIYPVLAKRARESVWGHTCMHVLKIRSCEALQTTGSWFLFFSLSRFKTFTAGNSFVLLGAGYAKELHWPVHKRFCHFNLLVFSGTYLYALLLHSHIHFLFDLWSL